MTKTNTVNAEPANKTAINKNLPYRGKIYFSKIGPRITPEQIKREEEIESRRKKLNRMIDIANTKVTAEISTEIAAFNAGFRYVFSTPNETDMDAPPGKDDISNYPGFEEAWHKGRMAALQANGINMGGRKSRKRRTRKSKRRKSYKRRR